MTTFKNPWGSDGIFGKNNAASTSVIDELSKRDRVGLGGEVTNDSDLNWLVSGGANSKLEEFITIPPGTNSDGVPEVGNILDGDVDALWPIGGQKIKNGKSGKIVSSGVFKIGSLDNANIVGNYTTGYTITDFTEYFKEGDEPTGWKLPKEWGGK